MSRAESVHNENLAVNEVCKLLSELLTVLGLLVSSESCILKNNDLAVVHLCNCLLGIVADYCIVCCESYLCIYQLCESCCCGSEGELSLRTVLRLAQMRAKNYLSAVSCELIDSRERSCYSVIVCDDAVLERNIEVNSYKDFLSFYINVINTDLV